MQQTTRLPQRALQSAEPPRNSGAPVRVDLDGVLLRTDLFWECLVNVVARAPWTLFLLPFWLLSGRAQARRVLASRSNLAIDALPFNEAMIEDLREMKAAGRTLVLVTSADVALAERVAAHLDLFQYVVSSNAATPVFPVSRVQWRDVAKSMRLYQWIKNVLVLVPAFVGHRFTPKGLLALAAFSLTASAVYMINDLVDLTADRRHASKRNRPFASGRLPLWVGLVGAPLLLGVSVLLCLALPAAFAATLGAYFAITCAYSFHLKRMLILDVATLAVLYTMRILAGGAAMNIEVSPWLLGFSVFLFTSLAFIKRFTEVDSAEAKVSRAYAGNDSSILAMLGIAAGYVAILVFALYINSPDVTVLYRNPHLLWAICPVLVYWISRIWVLASRHELPHDPILFAVKDKASYAALAVVAGLMIAAKLA